MTAIEIARQVYNGIITTPLKKEKDKIRQLPAALHTL